MQNLTPVRSTALVGSLLALVVAPFAPALAQQPVQRTTSTPTVRNVDRAQATEVQQARVLPDNFFELNDRAIIVVGGRQMQVAEVRKELSAELERLSGPPVTARSAARTGVEVATTQATPSALLRGEAGSPIARVPRGTSASQGPSPEVLQSTQTVRGTIDYCKNNPAKILRVVGPLRPRQPFTIQGECLGDRSGTVEVAGLPGRVVFQEWSNHRIVAVLPAVRGHPDKAVNLTVVRADKTRTAPFRADFVAARERVEVPIQKWTPNGQVRRQYASASGAMMFGEDLKPLYQDGEKFRLAVNPSCALIDAAWTQRVGRVTEFSGWEQGPPNAADVLIKWAPRCVTRSTSFIVNLSSSEICEIAFDLKAWASCPLGVAP